LQQLEFGRDPACKKCPLFETCKTVCIPTVAYRVSGKSKAVLLVGEAPGADEDKMGQPFVGASGKALKSLYIDYFKLGDDADVYLGNAVRCRPPNNDTPSKAQVKACNQFLIADLQLLSEKYEEVVVVCVGAVATQAVGVSSLRKGFRAQGASLCHLLPDSLPTTPST